MRDRPYLFVKSWLPDTKINGTGTRSAGNSAICGGDALQPFFHHREPWNNLCSGVYADKFFAFMVAGSKGTKMPRGDKLQIMTYPVALPSDEELDAFNSLALPIHTHIHSNRGENKRLSALRDALLPRLMSGELDVSEVSI